MFFKKKVNMDNHNYSDDESDDEEYKKFRAMSEMNRLRILNDRTYCHCLFFTLIVAIVLCCILFTPSYSTTALNATNFLNWSALAFYSILAFLLFTCNDSGGMRFVIIIVMSVFYGFSAGFILALNFTVNTRSSPALRGARTRIHSW